MGCPSCNSPLEDGARFCGMCGYRLATRKPQSSPGVAQQAAPSGEGATRAPGAPAVAPARAQASRVGLAARARKPVDDPYLGRLLNNRFKIDSKIGEGGFGAVYRGVQLASGRKVALKLLHPGLTRAASVVARFRREGMVLCDLRDAHTVTTYDFDQTPEGTLYIAMELLEGKSLHQIFHEEAPLDWRRVFKILAAACSSLAEAHAHGIVHRDLKPENIYLEPRSGNLEFVKVLDHGIAKVMRGDLRETLDPTSQRRIMGGQLMGSLEYMSPEQLMGKPLDGRSDLYALGVLAYEMITGRLPFPDAHGPAGLLIAQLKHRPVPPAQTYPAAGLPGAAERVILQCLENDREHRFADASQLAAALRALAGDAASTSRSSG